MGAIGRTNNVIGTRVGSYDVKIVFALQSLTDDVKMEETEEPNAVTKAKDLRRFRFINKSCIVELKFFECLLKSWILFGGGGEEAGKYKGLNLLLARKRFG